MGFKQYPDNIATTIYVDEEVHISDISLDENNQLSSFGIQLYKYGLNTDVKIYIRAYTLAEELIAESLPIRVADIPSDTPYFYGWFYFNFMPRLNMEAAEDVRFKLYLSDYTFSEASWIGAVYDWPVTMGYNDAPDQIQACPFALDLIGAK